MPRTLYLVRHTTPDIAPGVCYGQLDVAPAATFADEAAQTLRWLPQADLFIASPLLRAARLAEQLAQAQRAELRLDARLMEMGFGAWEGRPWEAIARTELDAWAADFMGYAPPGGESAAQLMQRAQALLQDLALLPHPTIALVAHAGSIRALLAHLGGQPLAATLRWDLPYGTVIGARY
jgi:alpha-ribazole phosphatase